MKKLFVLFLFVCHEASSTIWLPITKFRSTKATKPPVLPPELTEDHLYRLKIPNKRLCDELERQHQGKYLVIPWVFQNCQDLKDDVAKKLSPGDIQPVYKAVVNKLQAYRRSGLLKYISRTNMPRISRI